MLKPKVCILRSAGTNCDQETAIAFKLAGATCELVHINRLVSNPAELENFHILALPGGFSYGDDVASGKILANELRFKLVDALQKFIAAGKLVIGICNGFQILVKSGFLPGIRPSKPGRNIAASDLEQNTSLIINDSAKFEARWVYLKPVVSTCLWTKGLKNIIYLPVAHGEGKFVVADQQLLKQLQLNRQIVLQYSNVSGELTGYPDNPNGSSQNIAGICDFTGRVFGLMPHPERHLYAAQHPHKDRRKKGEDGLQIFKNGVEFIKKKF